MTTINDVMTETPDVPVKLSAGMRCTNDGVNNVFHGYARFFVTLNDAFAGRSVREAHVPHLSLCDACWIPYQAQHPNLEVTP